MEVLVTGGAGFIGSHVAAFYARMGHDVTVFDALSRAYMLKEADRRESVVLYNWNHLKNTYKKIIFIKADVRNGKSIEKAAINSDLIVHTAAQVAVTSSIKDPRTDFEVNALGTFNVLEAARRSESNPAIILCSSNKVYGENVNEIAVLEKETRYVFDDEKYGEGIPETFPTDITGHTPYGCSKIAGDMYAQDYNKTYGLDTCVFRMSCIYGTRQFGNEDQGWVAHFIISTMRNRVLTIYGDGKQVRDILFVKDLVEAFHEFFKRRKQASGEVFNVGGGPENTLSLLELLTLLRQLTGREHKLIFKDWRSGDQKVYVSDISKIRTRLYWKPKIYPSEGVKKFLAWFHTLQANI